MNKSIVFKTLALTFLFAFSLNMASAQKKNKSASKSDKEEITTKYNAENTDKEEPNYSWYYSVATVVDSGDSFEIKFEESKLDSKNKEMMQAQEMGQKMSSSKGMFVTESQVLNFLAEQNFELVSIVSVPEKNTRMMKYYLRTKVILKD